MKSKKDKSALKVQSGIEQPDSISKDSINRFKSIKKQDLSFTDYINGIKEGNITILSKAITLIESSLEEHKILADKIINECLKYSGNSIRIGISGVPGAGKSTFIEAFGTLITKQGKKLAVLAIDPSSDRSKGSILGDKTRMEELSANKNAFIRPSPSGGTLGGVARKTRETIFLCEAAGFDVILVETVGVGQSEIAVNSMVDLFLLLTISGAGDELQGIKRGIMEIADCILINKSDGSNINKAAIAKSQIENALHYFPLKESQWLPKVLTCSALYNTSIDKVWDLCLEYVDFTKKNQFFEKNRKKQSIYWMDETIMFELQKRFKQNSEIQNLYNNLINDVSEDKLSSFSAAYILLEKYLNNK